MDASAASASRLDRACRRGHYESWFVRANRADRPEALWIRYTAFLPRGASGSDADACGEVWAIWFDGQSGRHVAVRSSVPLEGCTFSQARLDIGIGGNRLDHRGLVGAASASGHTMRWDLEMRGGGAPLLLLPERLYEGGFPKAKSIVIAPLVKLRGALEVDGKSHAIDGWTGSLNHNWGSRHTDAYAWGQVAGFDDAQDVFLECASARVRVGPLRSPLLTTVALRTSGETIALTDVAQAFRARARYELGFWTLRSETPDVSIDATFTAEKGDFVGLAYDDPPGGTKTCLNSKVASCDLRIQRGGRPPVRMRTRFRAAFEILTDAADHGVPIFV